jgi:predicted metal-dependent HD superfamily phosphohydrolase
MLKNLFDSSAKKYGVNPETVDFYWNEVVRDYSTEGRYYHTIDHLEYVVNLLYEYRSSIRRWDILLMAAVYHDIVYDPAASNNEEESAMIADLHLTGLDYSPAEMKLCRKHILATKLHAEADYPDTNLLLDADIAILGADWKCYRQYSDSVRREYSIYSDEDYARGRKAVLQLFLSHPRIFKTEPFFNRFEEQARLNLGRELMAL